MKQLVGILFWLNVFAAAAESAKTPAQLIAQARDLAGTVGEAVWPGLGEEPFSVLLVEGDQETLFCRDGSALGFEPGRHDPATDCQTWTRSRQYPPDWLASFPLSDGIPTIVVGTPEQTGRDAMDWVLTLLHEHLHQLQYAMPGYYPGVAALDLAGDDQSGMWMLNYPFPYADPAVAAVVEQLGKAALDTLDAMDSEDRQSGANALGRYLQYRSRLQDLVSDADWRYAELQLWQEGVARWLELAVARKAAEGAAGFQPLATKKLSAIRSELAALSSSSQGRVIFYPLGAAEAMMLEASTHQWRAVYWDQPFQLGGQLQGVLYEDD